MLQSVGPAVTKQKDRKWRSISKLHTVGFISLPNQNGLIKPPPTTIVCV